ncbi:hypothetical protein FSARC_6746 [Fusarium sarcochroum]|uniref:Uncharacterized protein n=1 Tax=Fusarium sarcochroum TaxID=1208366 RepID=A0A8H4TWT5_9HYPO|nr:hypothetical protein FSARC_6746 [Fusarium sarcochroum]
MTPHPLPTPSPNTTGTAWDVTHSSSLAEHVEAFYAGLDDELKICLWALVAALMIVAFCVSVGVFCLCQYTAWRIDGFLAKRGWCGIERTEDDIENGGHDGSSRTGYSGSYPLSNYPTGSHPSGYTAHPPMGYTSSNPPAAYTQSSSTSGNGFGLSTADYSSGRLPSRYTTRPAPFGNGSGLVTADPTSGPLSRFASLFGKGAGAKADI